MKASKTAERSRLVRQLSWENKTCQHAILDEIRNYSDEVIAEVCRGCGIRIAEHGDCTGCGKRKRLTRFGAKFTRFCTGACESRWAVKEAARKKAEPQQPHKAKRNFHVD
jgi:hypothetical protein